MTKLTPEQKLAKDFDRRSKLKHNNYKDPLNSPVWFTWPWKKWGRR
jgi:hypothetical protein